MTGIRARQKQATQDRVLQAARTLFLARPYEDVGVRDIAAEAGVATGTVIGAFGSKAELLNTIVIDDFLAQFELIKVAVLGRQTVLERLVAMGMTCVNYHAGQLPLLRASLAHSWIRTQTAESQVRDAVRPILQFVREELSTAQFLGDIRTDAPLSVVVEMLFDVLMQCYRKMAYDGVTAEGMPALLQERFQLILSAIATQDSAQSSLMQSQAASAAA
jgi:AcrR family transcriptional regulator